MKLKSLKQHIKQELRRLFRSMDVISRCYLSQGGGRAEDFQTYHNSGLRAAADLPRISRRILIYAGKRELKTSDGIDIWSVEKFLQALATNTLWL